MTLGDRIGRATSRSHRGGRPPTPPSGGTGASSFSDADDQPQPAFGPEPPRPHQAGPRFPDTDAPADTGPVPGGWPSADGYYWYAQQAAPTEAPPDTDYRPGEAPSTDPFAGPPPRANGADTYDDLWTDPSANPPWAEASEPPGSPDPPPPGDDGPRSGTPDPDQDDVLPPADATGRDANDEHPTLTVRALQPATVYRQAIASAPHKAGKAGSPPSAATAAAALCGLLAVPMLATAGALFGAVSASGALQFLLPMVTLLMAAGCVVGGVRLLSRGSPLLPLLIAMVAVIAAVTSLARLGGAGLTDILLAGLWLVFTPVALIMVGLLRGRRVRRWLIARSQEWQATRPPTRRRFRLPAVHISLPKLRRTANRRPARKPTRVKQVGRHVRQRRTWIPWRRGPVSYVGRDSPRDH